MREAARVRLTLKFSSAKAMGQGQLSGDSRGRLNDRLEGAKQTLGAMRIKGKIGPKSPPNSDFLVAGTLVSPRTFVVMRINF